VDVPEEHVAGAIESGNGRELGGRKLVVNEARPKGSGGGGGFDRDRRGGGRDRY
jgi:hypothetical protein